MFCLDDLNSTAKSAMVARAPSDAPGDLPGRFTYPDDGGARIDRTLLDVHFDWAERNRGTILLSAACAYGKSSAICGYYKKKLQSAQSTRLSLVIPRQSLAIEMTADYRRQGLAVVNYMDAQDRNLTPEKRRVILRSPLKTMSPESYHTQCSVDGPTDMVFDEVCMTLQNIGGAEAPFRAHKNRPDVGVAVLQRHCRDCNMLVLPDADAAASPAVLDVFTRMCPGRPVRVIIFEHRPLKRKVVLHKRPERLLDVAKEAVDDFVNGRGPTCDVPLWVATAGKDGAFGVKHICRALCGLLPDGDDRMDRFLAYHGQVGSAVKRRDFEDFNGRLVSKLGVVANAALSVGINPKKVFGTVCLFTDRKIPCSAALLQCVQRANRMRHHSGTTFEVHMYLDASRKRDRGERPTFAEHYKMACDRQGAKWLTHGTSPACRTRFDRMPDWFVRAQAYCTLDVARQRHDLGAYWHTRFRYLGWKVVAAPEMSVSTLVGDALVPVPTRPQEAIVASTAELYKSFIERGVDTETFFGGEQDAAPSTRLGIFDREAYFALRGLCGFPFTDAGGVVRVRIRPGERTVDLAVHSGSIRALFRDAKRIDFHTKLRHYAEHPRQIVREIRIQAEQRGLTHPEFNSSWQELRAAAPRLELLRRVFGVPYRTLYSGSRVSKPRARPHGASDEDWAALDARDNHRPLVAPPRLVGALNLAKKLSHALGPVVLNVDDVALRADTDFITDLEELAGCGIGARLWRSLVRAVKRLGFSLKARRATRVWQLEAAVPPQPVSVVCEVSVRSATAYWPGWRVKHPLTHLVIPQFRADEHVEAVATVALGSPPTPPCQLSPIALFVDELTCRVDADAIRTLADTSNGALEALVVAPWQKRCARIKACTEWISKAARRLATGPCGSTYLLERYRRTTTLEFGRQYAGDGSVQSAPRELRAAVAGGYYRDYDIKNAHPVIVCGLLGRRGHSSPCISAYVARRAEKLRLVQDYYGCTRAAAKNLFLRLLNGGSPGSIGGRGWLFAEDVGISAAVRDNVICRKGHHEFVSAFAREARAARDVVVSFLEDDVAKAFRRAKTHRKFPNPKWTQFSWVVTYFEDIILTAIVDYINETHDRMVDHTFTTVGCKIFDGLLVWKETILAIRDCEAFVRARTGFVVEIVSKPFAHVDLLSYIQ